MLTGISSSWVELLKLNCNPKLSIFSLSAPYSGVLILSSVPASMVNGKNFSITFYSENEEDVAALPDCDSPPQVFLLSKRQKNPTFLLDRQSRRNSEIFAHSSKPITGRTYIESVQRIFTHSIEKWIDKKKLAQSDDVKTIQMMK